MSRVQAGQGSTGSGPGSHPPLGVEKALPAPDSGGCTFGGWTLRWGGTCWTVGRWVEGKERPRWKDATWHGRPDQAVRKLVERNVEGDVSDLAEFAERFERVYREISQALGEVVRDGRPE